MANSTQIVNLALSFLGQNPVLTIDNPQSAIEQAAALQYPLMRDAVLEAHNWTFAIGRATLSTPLAANPEWGFNYAFALPGDNLRVLWAGRQTNENVWESLQNFDWRIENKSLITDQSLVYIRYLRREEDPSKFSTLFVQALAARLAMELAVMVTQNVGLFERMVGMYNAKLGEAVANDGAQGRAQVIKQRSLSNAR